MRAAIEGSSLAVVRPIAGRTVPAPRTDEARLHVDLSSNNSVAIAVTSERLGSSSAPTRALMRLLLSASATALEEAFTAPEEMAHEKRLDAEIQTLPCAGLVEPVLKPVQGPQDGTCVPRPDGQEELEGEAVVFAVHVGPVAMLLARPAAYPAQ